MQAMNEEMERQLAQARRENDKLSSVMGSLGVSSRPTVSQWLQRKQIERRAKLQDSLISWDKGQYGHTTYYVYIGNTSQICLQEPTIGPFLNGQKSAGYSLGIFDFRVRLGIRRNRTI